MKTALAMLIIALMACLQAPAQSLTVVRSSDGGCFLEHSSNGYFRLGPQATTVLIEGMKKALEWYDLNQSHKMSFTKEIRRFKAMDQEAFEFAGYVEGLATSAKLEFTGSVLGGGTCILYIDGSNLDGYWMMTTRKEMADFLAVLQGKSVNPGVDNIFKP